MGALVKQTEQGLDYLTVPQAPKNHPALSFTIQTQISPGTLIVSGDARVLILNLGNGEDSDKVTYVEKRSDGTIRQQSGSWDGLMDQLNSPEKRIIQIAKPRFYESELIPIESLDPSSRTFEWKQLVPGTVIERTDGTREEIIAIESEERSGAYLIQSIVSEQGEITLRDQIVLDHQLTSDLFNDKIEAIWIPRTEQESSPGLKPLQPHEVTLTQESLNTLDQLALKTRRPVTIRLTGSSAAWLNPEASQVAQEIAAVLKDFDGVILNGDTAIYTDGLTPQRQFTAQDIPGLMEESPATVIGVRIDGSWREGTYEVTSDGQTVELPVVSVHKRSNSPDQITVYGGAPNHITAMVEPTDQAKRPSNWKWQGEGEAAVQTAAHLEKNHLFQKPMLLAIDGGQTVLEEIERYKTNGWPVVLYSPPESRANLTAVGTLVSELTEKGEHNDLVVIAETPEQLRQALEKFGALGECAWEQQLTSDLLTQPDSAGNTPEKGKSSPLLSSAHPMVQEWFKYVDEKMAEAVQKLSGSLQEGSIAERRGFCQMIGDLREAGDAILRFLLRAELHLPETATRPTVNEATVVEALVRSLPDVTPDNALTFAREYVRRYLSRPDSTASFLDTLSELDENFKALFSEISEHFLDQPAPVGQMQKNVKNCRIVAQMMSALHLDMTDPRVPDYGVVDSPKTPRYVAESGLTFSFLAEDDSILGIANYLPAQQAAKIVPELLELDRFGPTGLVRDLCIDPKCPESARVYETLFLACRLHALSFGETQIGWYVSADNKKGAVAHSIPGQGSLLKFGMRSKSTPSGEQATFVLMISSLLTNDPSSLTRRETLDLASQVYLREHPDFTPDGSSSWESHYTKLLRRFEYCKVVRHILDEMESVTLEVDRVRLIKQFAELLPEPRMQLFLDHAERWQSKSAEWKDVVMIAHKLVNVRAITLDEATLRPFFKASDE